MRKIIGVGFHIQFSLVLINEHESAATLCDNYVLTTCLQRRCCSAGCVWRLSVLVTHNFPINKVFLILIVGVTINSGQNIWLKATNVSGARGKIITVHLVGTMNICTQFQVHIQFGLNSQRCWFSFMNKGVQLHCDSVRLYFTNVNFTVELGSHYIVLYLLGTMNICTQCQGNPWLWFIYLYLFRPKWMTDWHRLTSRESPSFICRQHLSD